MIISDRHILSFPSKESLTYFGAVCVDFVSHAQRNVNVKLETLLSISVRASSIFLFFFFFYFASSENGFDFFFLPHRFGLLGWTCRWRLPWSRKPSSSANLRACIPLSAKCIGATLAATPPYSTRRRRRGEKSAGEKMGKRSARI